jgi:hypothetical protein
MTQAMADLIEEFAGQAEALAGLQVRSQTTNRRDEIIARTGDDMRDVYQQFGVRPKPWA